ncbi:MAG TPA: hypothetical protein VLU06_10960 [Thermoanaerobaculia bacterium]|nr:hypothetical protein [Thermoanaerobaculia bacterium]
MEPKTDNRHLTDGELFNLAVPPVGEPEALPRHLSECWSCSRSLQEWKSAVRDLADEETEELDRRSSADWEALEEKTIEAMRRADRARRGPAVKWAVSIAAALLLAIFLIPARKPGGTIAAFSAQDQKDDALLRDVARLSQGEDNGSWSTLAPEPAGTEEEQL